MPQRKPYDPETQAWIDAAETKEELVKRRQRAKYLRHGHKYRKRLQERYDADPTAILARNAVWRANNPEKVAADKLAWERQDREKYPEKYEAKWRKYQDKDAMAARGKKWRKENPGKNCAKTARRKAALLQRTPPWADHDAINFFYECRPAGCEVDHIIPLQGKYISGLHVAENLQWLPRDENRTKYNKWAE